MAVIEERVEELRARVPIANPCDEHEGWTFGEPVRLTRDIEGFTAGHEGLLVLERVPSGEAEREAGVTDEEARSGRFDRVRFAFLGHGHDALLEVDPDMLERAEPA